MEGGSKKQEVFMKKRLVSILLVLVMVLGMLPTVAAAADAPTEISSAEEFATMPASGDYILILKSN